MILIGYGGHGYVACGIAAATGINFSAYCDSEEKANNPFRLEYLGSETSMAAHDRSNEGFFIAIGNNDIRKKVFDKLAAQHLLPKNLVHPSAVVCRTAEISPYGVMIGAQAVVNPLARVGQGVILNTSCVVEHECVVDDFVHIGPGAVLCGNVQVGKCTFVGAGAVVRQGIIIGDNAMIGAGAVVIRDVPANTRVMGLPAK